MSETTPVNGNTFRVVEDSYTYYVPYSSYDQFTKASSIISKAEFADIVVNTSTLSIVKCRYGLIEVLDAYFGG